MRPKHLLIELAEHARFLPYHTCNPRGAFATTPGAYIDRLPEKQRSLLRELRSVDLADIRIPEWWTDG